MPKWLQKLVALLTHSRPKRQRGLPAIALSAPDNESVARSLVQQPEFWAAIQASLTPEQQQKFFDIVLGAPKELFASVLAQEPELQAALDSAMRVAIVPGRSDIPADLQVKVIVEELSLPAKSRGEMPRRIELCRQALAMVDTDEKVSLLGVLHGTLGNSLLDNPIGSRADNVEQAIGHYRQALRVYARQAYPEDWAVTQNNLGTAYHERIRGDRAENLEQAIAHYGHALEVRTRQAYPEEWGATQKNLAMAYYERIRGDRAENLEQAITLLQQALRVNSRQAYPEEWAATQNNLAMAYYERIRGDRTENLEQAITHFRRSLEVRTRQAYPEKWAATQNNLAMAYSDRIRGDRAENLEQAIAHYRQALEVRTRQAYPEDWAMTQHNLANAYSARLRGTRAENLDQAIAHSGQAIEVYTRQAYPERWASIQYNIAITYGARIRGERSENLEQRIAHCRQALEVYTRQAYPEKWAATQNNLAIAYGERLCGDRAENLEQAIAHYRQALEVRTLDRLPADFQQTQSNLGHLHFDKTEWAQALAAYREAIRAEQVLLASAYTEAGRRSETARTSDLYAPTAYALLKLDRPGEALVQLEQGKTRMLSRALALDGVDLSVLPEADQEALRSLRQTIRELEAEMRLPVDTPARRDDRMLAEALAEIRSRLNETIARIRVNHPDFMLEGLTLVEILGLIHRGAALVAPVVTEQGSAVFVVPGGLSSVSLEQVLWLDDFKEADLQTMLRGPAQEELWGGWLGAYFGAREHPEAWLKCIETTGQTLWDRLIGQIAGRLTSLNARQVLLMPQGGLGLLPLHVAWCEVAGMRRHFLDDYTITWLPSAYARRVSQDRLHDAARQARTLLAVVDPTEDLPFTPVEGEQVGRLFADTGAVVLAGNKATPEAVKQGAASHLHFACHGFYNWADPMQSSLLLAGCEPLTLAQIIGQFKLDGTRLVTLSACETGITDIRQSPDEYLGLPAGFLQAGAPAVVSTLWAVNDLSTMLLMERFYQLYLHEGQDLPEAMRQAQIWLRDVTAGELAMRFAAEEDEALHTLTRMPIEAASEFFTRFAAQDPAHHPFAHPFYWAAFTFSGA